MKIILLALLVIVAIFILILVFGAIAACMLSSKISQEEEKWRSKENDRKKSI